MSHPPAFSLTPADLATETGGRGFRVDELPVLCLGEQEGARNWMVFRTSCELRRAELGGDCMYRAGSSPGEKVPHPEEAGASLKLEGHRGGGSSYLGTPNLVYAEGLLPASRSLT